MLPLQKQNKTKNLIKNNVDSKSADNILKEKSQTNKLTNTRC